MKARRVSRLSGARKPLRISRLAGFLLFGNYWKFMQVLLFRRPDEEQHFGNGGNYRDRFEHCVADWLC
jgi:hypothetical protein